ncbi:MinD/ParA family ATP-binding protein [Paractinoplanes lichenicola]|uniref:ATPase n=1 Tax=Paractinoplanes lichenicola TaxID=2802976 RepID=A0ABS1VPP6_9ACTN|nr:AAA family ATPase [Actinoplanes lichenicola]MBL7256593.1 ATPase [Actinoplanes lichenicola]
MVQGGRAVDGTETGWGRPAEPAPRWRALLDRARHGSRQAEEQPEPEREAPPGQQPPAQQYGQPLPTRRPVNPLEARGQYGGGRYEQPQQPEPAPQPEQRQMPQRPINPLDPRWQGRQPEPNGGGRRAAPPPPAAPAPPPVEEPHSFFSPSSRPPAAPPPGRDYPQVRASAAAPVMPVQPPPVRPLQQPVMPAAPPPMMPVQPPPVAPQPTSPAPARIEWRQGRTDDELERAISVMRRKLGKPRVLAFANPKGGVHKTTATVLAAATIGSVRGRGVLAWDDNELRGTLGLRAGSARHARTIKHLLADLMQIENLHGDGLLQELDGYLRHASDGSYDVLAGEENPRFAARLDQATVRRVMDLLRRTHDVICVDTGNNVESVNWQTVMRQADQLVITTVPREDAAFTADWMLDVLDDSGMGDLVSNAVTLISCPSPGPLPLLNDFAKHFATRTRAVAIVPYDQALEVGSSIEYGDLQQETRTAWLKAASVMIEPFAE